MIDWIMLSNGDRIVRGDDQWFEKYPKRIELWEKDREFMHKVKGWNSHSVVWISELDEAQEVMKGL